MPRLALASPASPTPIPLLRTISLFRTLDDRSLGALAMHARLYTLPHGSFLDGNGADHEPLYIVAHGQLALYHRDGDERDVIVDVLQQDDLLGSLPFEAKALGEDAVLYCLSRPHVDRIAATHPCVGRSLQTALCRQVARAHERLDELARYGVYARLAHTLAHLACRHPRHEVTATHSELAAMIGTRQDEVSKLIKRLCRQGFITKQDRCHGLIVLDTKALASL